MQNLIRFFVLFLVGSYRTFGNLFMGGACRFQPSCSEYALQAIKSHTPIVAVRLILLRIFRCRPGGDYGYDPVPESPTLMSCSTHTDCRGHHGTT